MADVFDKASEVEMQTLQQHLDVQAARAAAAPRLAARGVCINPRCGEEFPPGDARLFCDSRCGAEYQRLARHF